MAFPTILIDANAAGASDSAASGAGPATALTGSAGVSAADGLSVILDGSPDLSGVAIDGSHVLYFADATAGARNFAKITNTANSGSPTATVTVSEALGLVATKAWAIGGVRVSLGSTTSTKLFSNNAAAGDAMPGWVVQLQSAHSETIAATYVLRRSGDTTSGLVTLQGAPSAATRPLLIFSNNGVALSLPVGVSHVLLRDFEVQNSNATKTASVAVSVTTAVQFTFRNIKISHSTNKFWKGFSGLYAGNLVRGCEVGYCASDGLTVTAGQGCRVVNCWIHDCGGHGVALPDQATVQMYGCLVYNNTLDGVNLITSTANNTTACAFVGNTFDKNGSDGIEITGATTSCNTSLIVNNIFSNNTGSGLNFSAGGSTAIYVTAAQFMIAGNCFFNNGSKYVPSGLVSENEQTADPVYVSASTGDFRIGPNLRGKGYPVGGTLTIGTTSLTPNYIDIGAAQRLESLGGVFGG